MSSAIAYLRNPFGSDLVPLTVSHRGRVSFDLAVDERVQYYNPEPSHGVSIQSESFEIECDRHVTVVATVTGGQNMAPGSQTWDICVRPIPPVISCNMGSFPPRSELEHSTSTLINDHSSERCYKD